mgnify:CR=1 FL=1
MKLSKSSPNISLLFCPQKMNSSSTLFNGLLDYNLLLDMKYQRSISKLTRMSHQSEYRNLMRILNFNLISIRVTVLPHFNYHHIHNLFNPLPQNQTNFHDFNKNNGLLILTAQDTTTTKDQSFWNVHQLPDINQCCEITKNEETNYQ